MLWRRERLLGRPPSAVSRELKRNAEVLSIDDDYIEFKRKLYQ